MFSTITSKLLITLLSVFTCVLVVSTTYQYFQQKNLINVMLSEQLHDKASNYFDSLNMMMLTGTMSQKETLRQKSLAQDGIEQVRVLRAESVSKLYGPGNKNQTPVDDIDRRALAGETVIEAFSADWGRGLVVALPMKSSKDYRGTNCVACHMTPEGEVLGAIRLEYNLSNVNKLISKQTFLAIVIMASISFAGFMITMWLIRKIVIRPIQQTSAYMATVSENKNLSLRLDNKQNDEVGTLVKAINSFMDTVSDSLIRVQETSHSLSGSASQLTDVAQITNKAASNQQCETAEVQNNIESMQNQQMNVEQATLNTSALINHTTKVAQASAEQAHLASQDINTLVGDIESVKDKISELNQRTGQVSSILEVINGIAEQTNLLALNAAIEAARAGDQGRGFAVVADEVRLLSSRTAEATGNIRTIISDLQKGSESSLQSVDTVCALAHQRSSEIEELSLTINTMVSEMQQVLQHATQIQQQTQTTTHLTQDVQTKVEIITQHANDTSHSAEQTRDISVGLEQLADRLEVLLNQFTLSNKR